MTVCPLKLLSCLYKKFILDYLWGVGKIYTKEEIDKAKLSPSFPREYELQYLGLIGNVFSTQSIEMKGQMKTLVQRNLYFPVHFSH